MKVKFCIGIILFLLMPATALVSTSSGINPQYPPYIETHTIKVAIDGSDWFTGWGAGIEKFYGALNYSWIVDDQRYVFDMDEINMTLYQNFDDFSMYNVIVMAGMKDEGMYFPRIDPTFTVTDPNTGTKYDLDLRDLKNNLKQFIHKGGGLNTTDFVDGMNEIAMMNLDWINKGSMTKLCLRSSRDINGTEPTGDEYVTIYSADVTQESQGYVPKLIIAYRNQSKIKNTGSTDLKGYLLIQVQYYDASNQIWVVDNDTVNEVSARTINTGEQLALDTIFNGHVRASDLTYDDGTYRVYTAFRDPEGNVLKTDVGTELEAWWQFSKT